MDFMRVNAETDGSSVENHLRWPYGPQNHLLILCVIMRRQTQSLQLVLSIYLKQKH